MQTSPPTHQTSKSTPLDIFTPQVKPRIISIMDRAESDIQDYMKRRLKEMRKEIREELGFEESYTNTLVTCFFNQFKFGGTSMNTATSATTNLQQPD